MRPSIKCRQLDLGLADPGGSAPEAGVIVTDDVQQGIVDLQLAVVLNESELSELVHKMAHARPRRPDHFGERLLTDLRYDRLWTPLLTEIRHQKKQPRQPLLAGRPGPPLRARSEPKCRTGTSPRTSVPRGAHARWQPCQIS
jgi:hypothetical protein